MTQTMKQRFDALEAWQKRGPIRRFRTKADLTVTQFADLAGCSVTNVIYWERTGGTPKKHLTAVAKTMGVHPATLQTSIKRWKAKRPA